MQFEFIKPRFRQERHSTIIFVPFCAIVGSKLICFTLIPQEPFCVMCASWKKNTPYYIYTRARVPQQGRIEGLFYML